jgi:regulatory protein
MARRRPSRSTASRSAAVASTDATAREEAYRFLARAPRSTIEMRAHLARRGYASADVDDAIDTLTAGRYLDDPALAQRRSEELMLRRGWGRLRVVSELTRRGFADSVVKTAIDAIHDDQSETELARQALRRKFSSRSLVSLVDRSRAFRYLIGRGHPVDIVTQVLGESSDQ